MKRIGVVGCGLMGSGIAQMSALNGYAPTVVEINDEVLQKGIANSHDFLEKGKKRGKVTDEQIESVKKNLSTATNLSALKDGDLVIEAVTENADLKKKLFKDLAEITRPDCILATNTSSISIPQSAPAGKKPERTAGVHFFN